MTAAGMGQMLDRPFVMLGLGLLAVAALVFWVLLPRSQVSAEVLRATYADPAPAPADGGLQVFHLGHSLVGRDMPAMLAQLAGDGHGYDSQLGWGTSLKQHWEPDEPINGFETENAHDRFRDAHEAVISGDYNAVVLTEMVELRDAVKYHDSATYLARWAQRARDSDPATRVYLYESWHKLDNPDGWLARLDGDYQKLWVGKLIQGDLARNAPRMPIYIIPAGQVMARFVRALETRGGDGPVTSREDLFLRKDTGELDPIHINDLGAYLVALTHYAVLYQRSPVGLPHALLRADGSAATAPPDDIALLMQTTVWDVVRSLPETGVPQ